MLCLSKGVHWLQIKKEKFHMHITLNKNPEKKEEEGDTSENVHFTETSLVPPFGPFFFQFLTCHHPLKSTVKGPYQHSTPLKSLQVGLKRAESNVRPLMSCHFTLKDMVVARVWIGRYNMDCPCCHEHIHKERERLYSLSIIGQIGNLFGSACMQANKKQGGH